MMYQSWLKPACLAAGALLIGSLLAGSVMAADSDSSSDENNLFSLYQEVQQLKQQVRELNGDVDTLRHRLQQKDEGQRKVYQSLDERLEKLEKGDSGAEDDESDDIDEAEDSDEKSAYMDGFEKLKSGKYDEAISAFDDFVSEYPDGDLTDNAWYWLGEANYVKQNLADARKAFDTVVSRFGDSDKVPGSLYKLGLIQAHQDDVDSALESWQKLLKDYPDSDMAKKAKDKLDEHEG